MMVAEYNLEPGRGRRVKALLGHIWMFGWSLVALAIVAGLMWFFAKAHSRMWRLAVARYAGSPRSPKIASKIETAIITTRGAIGGLYTGNLRYRVYPGLLVAIHENGVALSLIPPLNIMCPALFLPFEEMELKPTDWALWRDPLAVRMRQSPDIDIIVDREAVRWIREHTDRAPFGLGA